MDRHDEERSDDRPWRAEDLLRAVVDRESSSADPDASTTARVEHFLEAHLPPEIRRERRSEDATDAPADFGDIIASTTERDARARALPSEPPIEVANHRFLRCIARGGFGQVWIAQNLLTEHHRACKFIHRSRAIELDGLRHLKQRVPGHPNLFPIDDIGACDDWLYCLMPLAAHASGECAVLDAAAYAPLTLHAYLERHGRRPPLEVASIGAELAAGLAHLHAHGVTHGDIKPSNILRYAGHWTLADYGLARDLQSPTGSGCTPAYAPPEGPGTASADQYALGLVLLELLGGVMGKGRHSAVLEREPPLRRDRLGADLLAACHRATACDPDDRFDSLSEFEERLLELAMTKRERLSSISPVHWWAALASGLLVLACVMVLLALMKPVPTEPTGEAAPAPLGPSAIVRSFEVLGYRAGGVDGAVFVEGGISTGSMEAQVSDEISVHARLSAPGYAYLISFEADGRIGLRWPDSADQAPRAIDAIDVPSAASERAEWPLLRLDAAGEGWCGVLLLASRKPLPPWNEWVALHGTPSWRAQPAGDEAPVWSDGFETTSRGSTGRHALPRGAPQLAPIDWANQLRRQGLIDDMRFSAFAVKDPSTADRSSESHSGPPRAP